MSRLNRVTLYRAQKDIFNNIRTRKILEGDEIPEGCYLTENEALIKYDEDKLAKQQHYLKHKPQALKKLGKLEKDIKELLVESGCNLDYTMEGDTHGIYEDSLILTVNYKGHHYVKKVEF